MKVTCLVGKKLSGQNVKQAKSYVGNMFRRQKVKWAKCQQAKCLVGKKLSGQNVKQAKCLVGKKLCRQHVKQANKY